MTISVLIVDDQPLIRAGFRMILEDHEGFAVVGEAGDGEAAVQLAEELSPDVVLLDLRMPGVDGIEATRRIMAQSATARVLVLTTFDSDEYAYAALRAGASGFLLKNVPVAELLSGIRAVAQGHAVGAPRITRLLLDTYAARLPDGDTTAQQELTTLTAREREVLNWVARGLSNSEIAAELELSELTVKTHVSALLTKLGLRNRIAAVIYAREHGVA